MVYIDLNMVRAGAVKHPSEWTFCGYNELQAPPKRYTLIDRKQLMTLLGINNNERFIKSYKKSVNAIIERNSNIREGRWTQSIAVGDKDFVETVKKRLGYKAIGRKVSGVGIDFELKENVSPYRTGFPS